MVRGVEDLTDEERRALRGSKFAPLPSLPSTSRSQPRLAHPGGPLMTNKAAALAKFLERKLQDPNGLASIDPNRLEVAVTNAKQTFVSSGASTSQRAIRHVDSFGDSLYVSDDEAMVEKPKSETTKKKKKKNKKKKNNKKQKVIAEDTMILKRPKKKLKP